MCKAYATVCKQLVAQGSARPLRVAMGKYKKPTYRKSITIPEGRKAKVVYDPSHPLPWGAKAWIEWEIPCPVKRVKR